MTEYVSLGTSMLHSHMCIAGALAVNFISISSMGIEYCGGIALSLYNLLVL